MATIADNLASLAASKAYLQGALGSVETNFQELIELAVSGGIKIADVTLDGAWISGASADAGTDRITVADATGLTNGTPIEFYAGTGALPGGLTAHTANQEGVGDGDYYNIINLSGNTFQLTNTLGGATPVDITSVGTAGWQWRVAGAASLTASGLNLDVDVEYDVFYFIPQVKLTTTNTATYLRLNGDFTNFLYFSVGSGLWGGNLGYCGGLVGQKYSMTTGVVKVRKIADGLYSLRIGELTMDAPDRATGTARATYNPPSYAKSDTRNVTSIAFYPSSTAHGLIRNGARIVVVAASVKGA